MMDHINVSSIFRHRAPRMLLNRAPGGGQVSRDKLTARFETFCRGKWHTLLEASADCDSRAAQSRNRRSRRQVDEIEQRSLRAEALIQVGELSHARQVLEGAALAPGNQATLDALQDPERRPAQPRAPLPEDLAQFTPARRFQFSEGSRWWTFGHDNGALASSAR